ncbi:ester cyclase [Vibrio crassostreae]|uniref:ester cyclase n=1 Tax=Vibrio crassostreae TaxID=246167 RepID=UPI000F4AA429|nr:ester cyclase [Vibrio crassostreae]NOI55703.1 ester cyclase [Vibrio crassostreae]ROR14294.1 SnoaL-like polyketide cyclase [Vibrio crassostreae]ROR15859.1 SnoaL-like polyketide cyclase [Vibrio crassostreae]TCN77934.1 SnoaL-like polyketide cyclase [Vibrio crassostreae]TCV25811.1 SnoaL-like polyketide cyclase [Vibrio crassostreae]
MKKILLATAISTMSLASAPSMAYDLNPQNYQTTENTAQTEQVKKAALNYAKFWDTGKESYARAALLENFKDMTPPEGRKPGIEGVLEASEGFRKIVPNLHVEIEHLLVVGEYATIRYRFKGNFTGKMGDLQGSGQNIDFPAVDIYEIHDGKITKNWHLEDYNTFFNQTK